MARRLYDVITQSQNVKLRYIIPMLIGIVPNTAPKLLSDIVCEECQGVK